MIAERFPVSYPTGSGASQSLLGELGKHQEEVERPRSRLALASQAAAPRLPNPHSFRRGAVQLGPFGIRVTGASRWSRQCPNRIRNAFLPLRLAVATGNSS